MTTDTQPGAMAVDLGIYAAADLHVETIPGTEIMRDVGDALFVHGPKSGAVLIPHPSNNPNDPLNWSLAWKYTVACIQALYCFVAVASALSIAPMFPLLGEEFGLDETQLALLTGACVLALGYSNFFIVPFSNIFGRRLACIVLAVLTVATCIWEALARSYGSLLGARVVNGFATATSESLMVQVIADVFFLHERGLWMGIYFTSYFLGLFVGPVISGNIAARHGWRSFFWLSLGLAAFNVISLVVVFPETKYHREATPITSLTTGVVTESLNDKATEFHQERHSKIGSHPIVLGRGKPTRHQFALYQKPSPHWKSFLVRDVFSPFQAFLFPIILWAGLCVAGPANLLLLWNLTESSVLSSEPYNFSVSGVGYANFAFVVGGLVGLATAGPFSDWVTQRATTKNHGIREPEMRLAALVPFFFTTVVGIIVGGCAIQYKWNWAILLVVGYGCTGLCVTSVPTIATAYAIDCYKPISGEIMVVATVLKNTCGYAMSYWVFSLTAEKGALVPAMVEFALTVGPMALGLPLYFFGKRLRWLTKNSKMHQYESEI